MFKAPGSSNALSGFSSGSSSVKSNELHYQDEHLDIEKIMASFCEIKSSIVDIKKELRKSTAAQTNSEKKIQTLSQKLDSIYVDVTTASTAVKSLEHKCSQLEEQQEILKTFVIQQQKELRSALISQQQKLEEQREKIEQLENFMDKKISSKYKPSLSL